ncbi:pygopus homolog 2-like, partial [Heterodontus francisci]|uniref:pygopus homolog 2-like n=1 Tax=Heterodontus francisci TaxID=7792 RepID=UPI00355BE205
SICTVDRRLSSFSRKPETARGREEHSGSGGLKSAPKAQSRRPETEREREEHGRSGTGKNLCDIRVASQSTGKQHLRGEYTGANGGGTQLKSPEKKKRKSSVQAAQFSHLSEFAPPPTPMVDHLVASNPFDDDFIPPKGVTPPGPFFSNPGAYGAYRPHSSIPPHLHPAFSPGPQPMRRQPPHHFPPNQLAGGFGMPQNPSFGQPAGMNFGNPPFNPGINQTFSPPPGQPLHPGPPGAGPAGNFNSMMPPTMGQPPRGDIIPGGGPGIGPAAGAPMGPKFVQLPSPFNPNPGPRPNQSFAKGTSQTNLPSNASSFPSPDRNFPQVEDAAKKFSRPGNAFNPGSEHSASPAAVNGNQAGFNQNAGGQNSTAAADGNSFPVASGKNPSGAGHRSSSDPVYPCGFCLNEVNDDQDAILCEASCQKWFHRECTGMTETAYGLLTTETSAVWACDFCLKSKEIQSVYLRENLGQPVVNDG